MTTEQKTISLIDSYIIRGCFILPLGAFGIMHLIIPHMFDYMVPSFLGEPTIWVYLSGILLTITSISIFLKKGSLLSSVLLVLFVIFFIVTVDIPFAFSEQGEKEYFIISLMKDLSLLSGSITYLIIHRFQTKIYLEI